MFTDIVAYTEELGINVVLNEKENRFQLKTNEMMHDVGLSQGNVLLDIFYEETLHVVFLGLLRLPKQIRKQKHSTNILTIIKSHLETHEYTVFVDSCEGCENFWRKQAFLKMFQNIYGFDIMGYPYDKEALFTIWNDFKQTDLFKKEFYYYI